MYKPARDKTYWLLHLEKPLDEIKGKVFNKSKLLNLQEQPVVQFPVRIHMASLLDQNTIFLKKSQ
jgi:hypothetical protein